MALFTNTVITSEGSSLLRKARVLNKKITFTRCIASTQSDVRSELCFNGFPWYDAGDGNVEAVSLVSGFQVYAIMSPADGTEKPIKSIALCGRIDDGEETIVASISNDNFCYSTKDTIRAIFSINADGTGIVDEFGEIPGSGGGGGLTVDSELSETSKNPVQNAVLTQALNEVSSTITAVDSALKDVSANLQFVAEYNATTAQEIARHIDLGYPRPIVVKRGNDFYTSILVQKTNDSKVILRCIGSASNEFYIFTYTVTNGTWASTTHGLQAKLVSGTNIKTVNNNSILGEGNLQI